MSLEFSSQEYWSEFPFPSPGGLPDPGIEPGSPALQMDSLPSEPGRELYYFTITSIIVVVNQTTGAGRTLA